MGSVPATSMNSTDALTARSSGSLFNKQDSEAGAEFQKEWKQNYLKDP